NHPDLETQSPTFAATVVWAAYLLLRASIRTLAVGAAGVEHMDLLPHGASGHLRVSHRRLGFGRGWIDQHRDTSRSRHQLEQEFQPLCRQLDGEKIDARHVTARPREAGDKTELDRVITDIEDDRSRRGRRFGRARRIGPTNRNDDRDLLANQIAR